MQEGKGIELSVHLWRGCTAPGRKKTQRSHLIFAKDSVRLVIYQAVMPPQFLSQDALVKSKTSQTNVKLN